MAFDISLIIPILVLAVGAVIIFKFVKGAIKIIFSILGLVSLAVSVFGIFIVMDSIDLKNNFQTADKLVLLQDGNEFKAGLIIKTADSNPISLNQDQLDMMNENFKKGDSKAMLGSSYKAFILKKEALSSEGTFSFEQGITFEKSFMMGLLDSPTALDDFAKEYSKKYPGISLDDIKKQLSFKTDLELKAAITSMFFGDMMQQGGMIGLVNELKKGEISVYPETPIFKVLKIIPNFVFESVISRMGAQSGSA